MRAFLCRNTLQTTGLVRYNRYGRRCRSAPLGQRLNRQQQVKRAFLGKRLGVLYSQDGLNDTSNTQGCCCCGGNEITNAEQINVNILIYSLLQ